MISSRMLLLAAAVSMVANLATTAVAMGDCKKKTLDFVYLAGDASHLVKECTKQDTLILKILSKVK